MHLPEPDTPEWAKPVMFYGKPLTFNPRTHRYTWDGRYVPSVTTILSRLGKPQLVQWAANCAVDHIKSVWENYKSDDFNHHFPDICDSARKAHTVIRDTAGDVGTVVHEFARAILAGHAYDGKPLPLDATGAQALAALAAFEKWRSQHRIQPLALERKVFSADLMYAGTTDFYGYIDDEPAILDFKTGNGVYDEAWFQLAGYDLALTEELNLNRPMAHWIVHLGKNTGECKAYRRDHVETIAARAVWWSLVHLDKAIRAMPKFERA